MPASPPDGKAFLQSVKSISDVSNRIIGWSLSVVGGSILIILSDLYLHPSEENLRLPYLLFLVGWFFIACSINKGMSISGRCSAGELYAENETMLKEIFNRANNDFSSQIKWFRWSLVMFGLWLVLFLL